jgi:crotonobetaine/carnitine-CoA ligase
MAGREFLRFRGSSLTFGEAEELTLRLAAALRSAGVGPSDRVAIALPNGLEFPLLWLAVVRAGAVVVPVNPGYGESDLEHVLRDSGACLAIGGPEQMTKLGAVAGRCPELRTVSGVRELMASGPEALSEAAGEHAARPGDVVTIQYTSGTTGFPKGCLLTHEYWIELAENVRDACSLEPGDVCLTAQPFHYMDPAWNMVAALLLGLPLVILPRFSASTFWRSVRRSGATFFYCIGTMPIYLLKQPEDPENERGHRVRRVLCSGIPPAHHRRLEERYGCPWRETYGSTELGCVLLAPFSDAGCVGSGAMGAPVAGREVKVVDERGERVPRGVPGEMMVRGGTTMLGYHGLPEETARWRQDGWARTGDLVVEEENGCYRMVGRIKEMIRRAGENIAAAEVEAALCDHPAVRAAACVPVPDEDRGEEVKAYVQLRSDPPSRGVVASELAEFVRGRLAAFKVPRYIQFVESFPMTPSERIEKGRLLENRQNPTAGAYDTILGDWV